MKRAASMSLFALAHARKPPHFAVAARARQPSLAPRFWVIPPIYVKPFVKRQKNDAADAAAIAEAALRPNMHYVAVKSAEH